MSWMDRWNGTAGQLSTRWRALAAPQRRVAGLSVLAFLLLGGASLWWSTRPDWRTLFRNLEGRDAAQVQQELAAAGIPFQTSTDGTALEVAADNLDKARVAIAAKGMPQSGRLGFDLFDKPNWAGSEFDERVNYQRALEGELEHTIGTMDAVRSARVHLVLPTHSAFSSDDLPAKASVVLTLRRNIDARAQGPAMRALVASAVEGLSPAAVTLVDTDARVDFAADDGHAASREEEAALQQKLIALLEPLAGPGNVRATVNVSYHTGNHESTDEVYDPSKSAPTSTQHTEQTSQNTRTGGIPGTASNTPALVPAGPNTQPAATAAPTAPGTGATSTATATTGPGGQLQSTREESNTFAVTKHTDHSEEGPGRVRRITAAVVINDRAITEGTGKQEHSVWKPRSADEMKRLQQIAQAAVGFESARGDEVVVQNMAFSGNQDAPPAAGAAALLNQGKDLLRSQPSFLRSVIIGGSLLALGLLVLRPLGKQAVRVLALPAPKAHIQDAQLLFGEERTSSSSRELADSNTGELRENSPQRLLDQVSERIHIDPKASTRLVESWLSSGAETEA